MITSQQIKMLEENELAYLYYCLDSEWNGLNMGYPFDFYVLKSFRDEAIPYILNKYKENLTDENKSIIINILNKLNN